MSEPKPLKLVIECVEFCTGHETCDGCPSGLNFNTCDIDDDVLAWLKKTLRYEEYGSKTRKDPFTTRTY